MVAAANIDNAPDYKDVKIENNYWNDFYANFDIAIPSQFCIMVATEADKQVPIVEYGCGAGMKEAQGADTDEEHKGRAQFRVGDATCASDVKGIMDAARVVSSNVLLYSRFFLHTLDDEQEALFFKGLSEGATAGDKLYLKYRCAQDAKREHLYKGHYRRYVQTDSLVKALENDLGFKVTYELTGQGWRNTSKKIL